MLNSVEVLGNIPVTDDRDFGVIMADKEGTDWIVFDDNGPTPNGEMRCISVQASKLPKLIQILQKAFRQHSSKQAHGPQE